MNAITNTFFSSVACLALSGCILNVLEYAQPENANRIFDNDSTVPTIARDLTGFVQVGDNIPVERVTAWMEKRCSEISDGSYALGSRWKGTAGPHSTPIYYKCILANKPAVSADVLVDKQPLLPSSPPSQKNIPSLSDAKDKCGELGFKQGTEGFGKCVLQLSK